MIPFDTFVKKYFTYRPSDLTKVVDINEIKELPTGVILHTFDNMLHREMSFIPRLDHPLFQFKTDKTYLHHVTSSKDINIQYATDKVTNYPLVDTGVSKALMKYKTANVRDTKIVDTILHMPARYGALNIVSYNSLFRAKIRGTTIKHNRLEYVLAHVVDIIASIKNRQHFIHIPVTGSMSYDKEDFTKAFKKHDRASLKYGEDYFYLFLVQFLCYLNAESNIGILQYIPEDRLKEITLVITNGDKAIFYNLAQLLEMNGNQNKILRKVIYQIRSIVLQPDNSMGKAVAPVDATIVAVEEGITRNSPYLDAPATEEAIKKRYAETTAGIDASTTELLDTLVGKTPKQKQLLAKKAVAYKSLTIGNESVEDILTKHTEQDLNANKLDFLSDVVIDKSMLTSNIFDFDNQYMEKSFKRDMVATLTDFNKHGMFLTDIKETVVDTEYHKVTHYKVTFEDTDLKKHTVKFTLPLVDKDGIMTINGAKKGLKKQRVNRPICKVSPTRVTLNASFNKSIVERKVTVANSFRSYFSKLIAAAGAKVTIDYGKVGKIDKVLPYEYTIASEEYRSFTIDGFKFNFNYPARMDEVNSPLISAVTKLEATHGVYVGKSNKDNVYYFMKLSGEFSGVTLKDGEVVTSTTMVGKIAELLDIQPPQLNEWVELKILNKSVPVVFALCYQYGLSATIKYLELEHELYEAGVRIPYDPTMIKVKFKDKTLVFKRTPLAKSLIFAGLNNYKLNMHHIADMDSKDVYNTLMMSKKLSLNYLKGIDSFFQLFLDAITIDVLAQMKEPTNVRDLLIRATTLLTTTDHPQASADVNFRYRSFEKFPVTVSNELSRAFATWKHSSVGHGEKFSINPNVIYLRILKDQLTDNVDINNPIHDIKRRTAFSHMGDGGRSRDSLVIKDRQFAPDSTGIVGESTIDGPTVGINASTSMDPAIVNTRGISIPKDHKDITPTELLSVSGLVIPGITHDDELYITQYT